MYNKVFLIGNLTRDPELRYTPSGIPVVRFTLAVNRPKAKGAADNQADFINIVAWRKLAEICGNYLVKGKLVFVEGRIQTRSWEDKDGVKRFTTEIVANDMKMLDSKGKEAAPETMGDGQGPDGDVPF